jgi:hypothetical protein
MPPELWGVGKAVQDERLEHDPWIDKLASLQGAEFDCGDGKGKEERIIATRFLVNGSTFQLNDRRTPSSNASHS